MNVTVIVNPKAGSGAARELAPEVARAVESRGGSAVVRQTEAPGDATRLARESFASAVDCIAVVGGDGTLNEVAQAFVDGSGVPQPGPALALVPAGTGSDFQKTLGIERGARPFVERLFAGQPRSLDLGYVELTEPGGGRTGRAFINIMSFGLGGLTDRIVNRGPKWLGGRATFYLASIRALAAYRNAPVRVKVNGEVWLETPIVNVAIANGRYFGGGMLVAPDADPSDGAFDVVAMCDMTKLQAIALTGSIYQGRHLSRNGVMTTRGALVEAEPLAPNREVLIDLDGETPGQLPLVARVLPGALRFFF